MPSRLKIEFQFRVWAHPMDGDPAAVSVWCHELESTQPGTRFASEWVLESFQECDFHEIFELDEDSHWQIIGKATISGSFDYFGEYDEDLDIIEYEKVQVPDRFFKGMLPIEGEPH